MASDFGLLSTTLVHILHGVFVSGSRNFRGDLGDLMAFLPLWLFLGGVTSLAEVRVATFFREIGRSDSKIHMLMSEVVNKLFVEGFVKKTSTSWVNRFFVPVSGGFHSDCKTPFCTVVSVRKCLELSEFWARATRSRCRESRTVASHLGKSAKSDNYI